MRYLFVLLLAACSAPVQMPDVSDRDHQCVARCYDANAICITSARGAGNRLAISDIVRACDRNTSNCLSACPRK